MKKHHQSIYVFNHDLRITNNPLLNQACQTSQQMLCLYCLEPWQFQPPLAVVDGMGAHRWQFLRASLLDLQSQLQAHGMALVVRCGHRNQILEGLLAESSVDAVFQAQSAGDFEQRQWRWLQRRHPDVNFYTGHNASLFDVADLPFALADLPPSFTPFRKQVETVSLPEGVAAAEDWPDDLPLVQSVLTALPQVEFDSAFTGGQTAATAHLNNYFESSKPSTYKMVRNALDGWQNSTKFSPWLALGCVSPQQIVQRLRQYEVEQGANESTYWIYFELLWREYFYWYGHKHGARLFWAHGIKRQANPAQLKPSQPAVDSQQLEAWHKWCVGQTGVELIDACMKQLNSTGYMSNRGRQIVASFLIHELQLDWRWGAQYFEQQLLDYDVASNWGNWQYIAGVGADPRGGRRFNWLKQQQTHDPHGKFVSRWADQPVVAEWVNWESLTDH